MADRARPADPFDVDAFLAQPLIARGATVGPTVRPVWYIWEEVTRAHGIRGFESQR